MREHQPTHPEYRTLTRDAPQALLTGQKPLGSCWLISVGADCEQCIAPWSHLAALFAALCRAVLAAAALRGAIASLKSVAAPHAVMYCIPSEARAFQVPVDVTQPRNLLLMFWGQEEKK